MSEYRDLWYQGVGGLRLYARDYPGPEGATLPPVLCMHGLTRNSSDFASLASHLCVRRRVLSVDQRGRGRSDHDSNVGNYTPATYVQDMFQLLGELNVEEVILCGTSMGGLMSFIMGAMQPARIRGMILNDIGPEVDEAGLDRIRSYVGKVKPVSNWQEAIATAKLINGIAFPDFSDQEWEDFTRGIYRDKGGVPVLAYDPAIAQPMDDEESGAVPADLWPLFDAVSAIPMLLVRGATSDILAPSCVATMQEKKPDLQFAEIPNRGHAPTLNEAASRAAIDQFLQGLG